MKTLTRYALGFLPPILIAGVSALLTPNSSQIYKGLTMPPLAPPSIVFPIVWSLLFLLMGVSFTRILKKDSSLFSKPSLIFFVQLIANMIWSLLFFRGQFYALSFAWLVVLWLLIFAMIRVFSSVDRLAARLQIPYLLWVTFAGYLNLMIALLNR